MRPLVHHPSPNSREVFGNQVAHNAAPNDHWGIGGFGVLAHRLCQRIQDPVGNCRHRHFLGLQSKTLALAHTASVSQHVDLCQLFGDAGERLVDAGIRRLDVEVH